MKTDLGKVAPHEEGLKTSAADEQPADSKITAAEWFRFASRRVPELQTEAIRLATEAGRLLTFDTPSPVDDHEPSRLQTPRWYYRRDPNGPELVVAVQRE